MIKTYLLALALLVPAISAVPVPVREGTTLDSSSFLSRAGLRRATEIVDTPTLETVGLAHGANQKTTSPTSTATPHGLLKRSYPSILQRASDDETAGGNAYSGRTGDVDSGNVNNITGEGGTITNAGLGNNSGPAGATVSGNATGGAGKCKGPGGNAYTGETGSADGGYINNQAGTIQNESTVGSSNAGTGGESRSGDATGGTGCIVVTPSGDT